jgi:hypothetical protein
MMSEVSSQTHESRPPHLSPALRDPPAPPMGWPCPTTFAGHGVVSGHGFSRADRRQTKMAALAAATENQGLKAQVQNRAFLGTAEAVP